MSHWNVMEWQCTVTVIQYIVYKQIPCGFTVRDKIRMFV